MRNMWSTLKRLLFSGESVAAISPESQYLGVNYCSTERMRLSNFLPRSNHIVRRIYRYVKCEKEMQCEKTNFLRVDSQVGRYVRAR